MEFFFKGHYVIYRFLHRFLETLSQFNNSFTSLKVLLSLFRENFFR
jgi:hypothetical protein